MKVISARIDDKDYAFLDTLAKNRGMRVSNIGRLALHEFVVAYTGEVTLHGLDAKVNSLRIDVSGLKTWATKTEGKIELLAERLGGDKTE